jgi:type I restriction enzyme S subunit
MSRNTITTATEDEATHALVPKLRFPEFLGAEGWQVRPLSEFILSLDAGVSVNSGDRPALKGEVGVLKTSAVTYGVFEAKENKLVSNEIETQRLKEPVCRNTIIISRMNTPDLVGANAYVEYSIDNLFLPDRLWAAKPKSSASMRFLSYILGSPNGRAALRKLAKGSSGSMKNITKPDVLGLLFMAPLLPEQQKIAECLNSVDDLMAAQSRKVDTLKTHKKALMQQLFPREGETQPQLRFPEFESAKAWQRQRISNLLSKVSDSVTVEPDGVYREIGIRSHGKGIFHKDLSSGKQIGSKRVFSVVRDAFVVNIVFAWEQAIATTSIAEEGMIASHRFPMYVALAGRCHVNYVKYFFLTKTGKYLLGLASPGGAGRNRTLGQKEFEKLEIILPQEVDEQMRIADCLSSIDALISLESQKLEALKAHKKGLMQQLFPSLEANEG